MTVPPRKMPRPLLKGDLAYWQMEHFVHHAQQHFAQNSQNEYPQHRHVMGYRLPDWQRPAVWTERQSIRFIESCFLRLDIGRFVITQADFEGFQGPLDNLLIDGQQRLTAVEAYLNSAFPVFGYTWSELESTDRRSFLHTPTPTVKVIPDVPWSDGQVDEAYLKDLYTRLNYGGTPHRAEDHPETRVQQQINK